jgi:ELWxxDGT repeat protein
MKSYKRKKSNLLGALVFLMAAMLPACDDLYHKAQHEIENGKTFSFLTTLLGGGATYQAQGLSFNDTAVDEGYVGGTFEIKMAQDETQVSAYEIYWGNGLSIMDMYGPILTAVPMGMDLSVPIAVVSIPPGATHYLIYSKDLSGNLYPRATSMKIKDMVLRLVADINTTPGDSNPADFAVMNDILWFTADAGSGPTIYAWNGTLNPLPVVGSGTFLDPHNLYPYDGTLYFSATGTGGAGEELWTFDGYNAPLMFDIYDFPSATSSFPSNFCGYGNRVFFRASYPVGSNADTELFAFAGGPFLFANINQTNTGDPMYLPNPSMPGNFKVFNNRLYFSANDGSDASYELWVYTGGPPQVGTNIYMVYNISPGSFYPSYPANLTVYNGKLFFSADDGTSNGRQLWAYTGSGTPFMIPYVNDNLDPSHMVVYHNKLYFKGSSPTYGVELWVYDDRNTGSTPGIVADINIGAGSSSAPQWMTVYRDRLFFYAYDGTYDCLWVYDDSLPESAGINPRIVATMPTLPQYLTVFNNGTDDVLCFQATEAATGAELWEYYEK